MKMIDAMRLIYADELIKDRIENARVIIAAIGASTVYDVNEAAAEQARQDCYSLGFGENLTESIVDDIKAVK